MKLLLFLTFLLGQCFLPSALAQKPHIVDSLIRAYSDAELQKDKHALVLEIMESNSDLQASEARKLISNTDPNSVENILATMSLADAYYYQNLSDSSMHYYLRMAHLAELNEEYLLTSWGYGNCAYILEQQGKLGEALQMRKASRSSVFLANEPKLKADYSYNVGGLYLKLGKLDSATHYIKETIEIDRLAQNQMGIIHDLLFLIELYFKGNELDKAILACEECAEYALEIDYQRGLAMCYYLMADAQREKGDSQLALSNVNKAIEIDKGRKDITRMSMIAVIKAKILSDLSIGDAIEWYQKALDYGHSQQNIQSQCQAALGLAELYSKQGNTSKTHEYLELVDDWSKEYHLEQVRKDYLEQAYPIYKNLGELRKANTLLEEKEALVSSNLNELLSSQADNIDQSFDLFAAQRDYDRLAYEKEIQELNSRRKNNIFFGGGVVLLLSSLLWYYAYQNQKNRTAIVEKTAEENELRTNNRILKKEMDNLRSQMNPHFLFNSLNSINDYVMHEDPKLASIYLTKFSKLMRMILNNSKQELISLSDEIDAVKLYMELERIRFKDKFRFVLETDSQLLKDQLFIPPMFIQPFLENAVKHGMKNLDRQGLVKLSVKEENDNIVIKIEDNGIGRMKAKENQNKMGINRKSYGMKITSDRIDLMNAIYDVNAQLHYRDLQNPTGTEVVISLKPLYKKPKEWKELRLSS